MYNKEAYELMCFLKENNLKISFAESCTGGMMAKYITDISGSSSVLSESYVTYSEEAKCKLLGVDMRSIKEKSVVSAEVARQMAKGLLKVADCDIAVSITGVAGPNSDSYNNPVGLAYVGIAIKDKVFTKTLLFSGSRDAIRQKACKFTFETVKKFAKEIF